jgi:hypothetical protein
MPAPTPVPEARAEVVQQPKGLEKKKSKSLLRGKGRRGELSVNVSPGDPDESVCSLIGPWSMLISVRSTPSPTAYSRLIRHTFLACPLHRLDDNALFVSFSTGYGDP